MPSPKQHKLVPDWARAGLSPGVTHHAARPLQPIEGAKQAVFNESLIGSQAQARAWGAMSASEAAVLGFSEAQQWTAP